MTAPAVLTSDLEALAFCPLCRATRLSVPPVAVPAPFGLKECDGCTGVFLSPRPKPEAMKVGYDVSYPERPAFQVNAKTEKRWRGRAERHVRRLARYFSRPGHVLDVGAGDGLFLKTARAAGWKVDGVELSSPLVQRARESCQIELCNSDLSVAPFAPESFEAVTMFQLIEHLHAPGEALVRARQLLRPGGLLLLSTPNALAYPRKQRPALTWSIPWHLVFFTPYSLVRTVEAAGFTVIRPALTWQARIERSLGWRPWPNTFSVNGLLRNALTPFGLWLVARKK